MESFQIPNVNWFEPEQIFVHAKIQTKKNRNDSILAKHFNWVCPNRVPLLQILTLILYGKEQ